MRPLLIGALLALLIGLLLVAQGLVGLVAPDMFVSSIRFIQTPPVVYLAAVLRVAFGVVLVRAASNSRLPKFLHVLGFIVLIGGLLTPFVGLRFSHFILDWWSATGPALVRVFAGVSLALGILVVHAMASDRRNSLVSQ